MLFSLLLFFFGKKKLYWAGQFEIIFIIIFPVVCIRVLFLFFSCCCSFRWYRIGFRLHFKIHLADRKCVWTRLHKFYGLFFSNFIPFHIFYLARINLWSSTSSRILYSFFFLSFSSSFSLQCMICSLYLFKSVSKRLSWQLNKIR